MKTLTEYNKEKSDLRNIILSDEHHPNGILCDNCGAELFDNNPHEVLVSIPPKKAVECPSCGFKGYRIA